MQGRVLITTTPEGMQPLGSAAQRSYEMVSSALRQRLGEAHAALLAEPVTGEHGDQIDWHAPVDGRAVPLRDLDEADRAAVEAALGRLTQEILSLAADLRGAAGAEDRRLGEALANAVEIPSRDMIFAVEAGSGLQPVLAHWAWVGDDAPGVRGALTGYVPRRDPVVNAGAGAPGSGTVPAWLLLLGWLLLAILLAAILWLTLRPCGLAPWGPDHCRKPEAALAAAFSEQAGLQDRVDRLRHEIALADRSCQPTIPVTPAENVPDPAGAAPEKEGALPPGLRPRPRRLAGPVAPLYTETNPVLPVE